jgi:hypothetical protein
MLVSNLTLNIKAKIDSSICLAEYSNPLLTPIELVFTDDKPNANKQGIKKSEFPNIIKSMSYMPIKANFNGMIYGHANSLPVGIIIEGKEDNDKIIAHGALYNDEFPELVEFLKHESSAGKDINFSWELRYKDSVLEDGVSWLTGVVTKAITAVSNPAYEGRTNLLSISSKDLLDQINNELKNRGL